MRAHFVLRVYYAELVVGAGTNFEGYSLVQLLQLGIQREYPSLILS
jgi:hypothetical protein